jgi:hypothetical protein
MADCSVFQKRKKNDQGDHLLLESLMSPDTTTCSNASYNSVTSDIVPRYNRKDTAVHAARNSDHWTTEVVKKTYDYIFILGECILLRMYQISKYRQLSFATVLQRVLLYTYITTCFG